MSDPKRWRETEGEETGAFVAALSSAEPTPQVREAVWAKIAPTLPPGPGEGPSGNGNGGGAAGAGIGAKAAAAVIAMLGAGALAAWIASSSASAPPTSSSSAPPAADEPPPPSAAAAATLATRIPPAAAPSEASSETRTTHGKRSFPSSSPRTTAPSPAPVASVAPTDRLREEAEGVRRVRQLLREKKAGAALAELDRLAALVPNGPLEEEREVLTIEALAASGSTDAARRRADRFLFERPQSVHAARVRAISTH